MQVSVNTEVTAESSSTIEIILPPANQEKKVNQLKASVSKSVNAEVFCADLIVQENSTSMQDKLLVQGVIGNSNTMSISIEFTTLQGVLVN